MTTERASFGANLSIAKKGLLIIAVPVVAQLGALLLLHSTQSAVIEAERWAIHSKDVILRADEIQRLAIQSVSSQRAAVISGDADYHEPLDPAPGDLRKRLDSLAALVSDNRQQRESLEAVRDEVDKLDAWLREQRALVRDGRREDAAARISRRVGATRLEAVRTGFSRFLAEEQRLSQGRSAELRRITEQSRMVTWLAVAVSLGVAGFLGYLFSHEIASRFSVVMSNAERLAAGGELARPLAGADEIARLDAVLHETNQKLSDASAIARQARLESELRLVELAQVNRELQQQTEENETFIYSVSHDLRSPLVNLQGFSKELAMTCAELEGLLAHQDLPQSFRATAGVLVERDVAESIHYIRTAVSRASAIIDSLLRLSRAGRVEYRLQRVRVQEIVNDVVDAMRSTIAAKGADVSIHPLDDAWGDRTALEQIFANLIGNAVNYLDPDRPGKIEIGMARRAEAGEDGPVRTYYVRDNGRGIPESALPRIFSAFQRHHAEQAPGEGVGLLLVRRMVERHRGRIWVESREHQGSTFYVELPAGPPPDLAAKAGDTEAANAPST
jgi:signal transduction histidine kinase